jgi:hypothetical protein
MAGFDASDFSKINQPLVDPLQPVVSLDPSFQAEEIH